jgi:hypothetical protein
MIVAIAFASIRSQSVAMRGIIFCPQPWSRLLVSRLRAGGDEPLDSCAIEERRTGCHWVRKHFDCAEAAPPGVDLPAFRLQRYFAFARVKDAFVSRYGVSVRFDVFVGPGEMALPVDDRDEARPSARAVHGFAHVTHHTVFDYEIARSRRSSVSGDAAFCLVAKPDDLLGDGWRVRRDGVFQIIPKHEVGARLLVEPAAYGRERGIGLRPDAVVGNAVRDPLERGFVFRTRLVVELPEVRDEQVVGL